MNSPPPSQHTTDPASHSNILVTTPSSPDTPARTSTSQDARTFAASRFPLSSPYDFTFHTSDTLNPPSPPTSPKGSAASSTSDTPSISHFDQLMQHADLPEPGPAFFAARRALWRTPPPNRPFQQQNPTLSHQRLEALLNHQKPPESDEVWNAGLGKVWRGIIGGARLKRRLPLNSLIKLLQAGWIRDGTWPRGGIAPDPEDLLVMDEEGQATTEVASIAVSPTILSPVSTPGLGDMAGPSRQYVLWDTSTHGVPGNS